MINCDETPFFKKEILVAAIALSNSGGGTVFAEGEVLADKSLRHKIVDYIAENSLPSVFVLSDVLFPETHIKFTVPTVENHSATLWGDAFGISKNGKTERLFQKRAIKLEEAELTVEEDFRKTFDTETVEKVAERLSKTRKYKKRKSSARSWELYATTDTNFCRQSGALCFSERKTPFTTSALTPEPSIPFTGRKERRQEPFLSKTKTSFRSGKKYITK